MITSKYPMRLTISVSEAVYQKIQVESDKQQVSKADYVRKLLDQQIKTNQGGN